MNNKKSKSDATVNKSLNEAFNVELFNNVVAFIFNTTNMETAEIQNKLLKRSIYFENIYKNNIQEKYGFKYFGELLERYEEKIENNIYNVRAIALALGYCKELVTKEMIIGNQEENFINKIELLAPNDIYLVSALYLYDKEKYLEKFLLLKEYEYKNTEDIIFILSVYDDFKEGYEIYQEQLIKLLGKNRSISVFDNIFTYEWIIHNLAEAIGNSRKKELDLFRALITIPTIFMKEDNKYYSVLINNQYSKEEIAYLNYAILEFKPVEKTVRMRKSIIEEKIAVRFCETILNSEKSFSEETYEYLKSVIEKYNEFDILCYGEREIKNILFKTVNITNPITFIEMYEILNFTLFKYDILDNKWDLVAEKFETKKFETLFDNYLLEKQYDKGNAIKAIEKYRILTKNNYLESFNDRVWIRQKVFDYLANICIFDIKNILKRYIDGTLTNFDFMYFKDYVSKINNHNSFLLLKDFLKEHKIHETDDYGFNIGDLVDYGYSYRYREDKLHIKRDFLSKDEQKELFEILDQYEFKVKPNRYVEFIISVLESNEAEEIMTHEELRELYFEIAQMEIDSSDIEYLKYKYLTEQEKEEERYKEQKEKEHQEMLEMQQKENEIKEEFNKNKENIKQVKDFYYEYHWYRKEESMCYQLVKDYLKNNISSQPTSLESIKDFNELCNELIKKERITLDEYKDYVTKYIMKGNVVICN